MAQQKEISNIKVTGDGLKANYAHFSHEIFLPIKPKISLQMAFIVPFDER